MNDTLATLSPKDFPPLLREIPDAPKKLYARGTVPNPEYRWLAIVGSRAATQYGRQVVRHIVEKLRGYPIVIVSGLAYGIDAEAHRAALDVDLPTVAIPGSGLDWNVLYPRAHVNLARDIVQNGGVLLSELDPDIRAAPYMFPKRNRIMAGLCHATLVVEAHEQSGSLITARLATEYNRELLVVPGSIFSAESRGTHQFLKLGATPITEISDILSVLKLNERPTKPLIERKNISENELRVLTILADPRSRDELVATLNVPISEANILLSMMEIKGLIVEELGVLHVR